MPAGIAFFQMKFIAIDRKEMVGFSVAEPVNFFAVQPEHIGQAMRSPSRVAQVGFIHNAAPISHNEYSAILKDMQYTPNHSLKTMQNSENHNPH